MDIRKIKKLIELLEESDIGELEIREGEESVRISRNSSHVPQSHQVYAAPAPVAPAAAPPAPSAAEEPVVAPSINGHVVKSPMVGTFYAAASPDSPPYVQVGDRVKAGTVMCIIEAMKLMNEIEADVAGVVREVLVENDDPVEYGQVLFRIEPD